MRVMGIDWGEIRIGVAISDPLGITALPLPFINNDRSLIKNLQQLLKKYDAGEVVLGLPLKMNGELGEAAEKVELFRKMLSSNLGVKISMLDERLTSKLAEKSLISIGQSRQKRKKSVDSISACVLLQNYIDKKRNEQNKQ